MDLKDLNKLPAFNKVEKVASFKPYLDWRIKSSDQHTGDEILDMIALSYVKNITAIKENISEKLMGFYNRPLRFSDNITTQMTNDIAEMMEVTGKSPKDISKDFRNYLGYPCSFFRKDKENRTIPIDCKRITEAYKAMKAKQSVKKIEKILYENS